MISPHFPRHRVRSDGRYYKSHYGYNATWGSNSAYEDWYYESSRASMDDCINPIGSRGFRSPGPCQSYKIRRYGNRGVIWTDASRDGSQTYFFDFDHAHYDLEQIVNSLPHIPVSIVADNCVAAGTKAITQVPTVVALANFLWEARELKSSLEHYQKAVTRNGTLKIGKKKAVIREGLKLQDVPGWANATLLDVDLNVLPMVGDMVKMFSLFDSVSQRLDFLRKNRGKPVRQSFNNLNLWSENPNVGQTLRTDTHVPPFTLPGDWYMGWDYGGVPPYGYTDLRCDTFQAHFSASWYLLQNLQGLDDAWAMLRALIAGTGFNNPAKIIWNAIPFSFVVDWMVPFGKALDYLAVQPFTGQWEVYDTVHSIKESWWLQQGRHYYGNEVAQWQRFYNPIYVERYERKLGLDVSFGDFDPTDFDKNQQLLLSSLLAGNTLFRSGRKK